ncbi:Atg14 domain-containing protein [Methylobacterium organophilum]|nr:Atg14 domain-containing protein [Methylobacterium organophilum]
MIETVMSFALGFLLASLCALLVLPAVSARAARLTRRRMEAALPLSTSEIAAERDALRAEFAVLQRRLERKVDEARAKRQADMVAIGARTLETAAMARRVEEREAELQARKAEIEAALARIDGLDKDLAALRSDHDVGLAALQALEAAHRELLDDLRSARRERESARRDLAAQLGGDGTGTAVPLSEHEALLARLDATERMLSEVRDADADHDHAALRARITEVADALAHRDRLPVATPFAAARG